MSPIYPLIIPKNQICDSSWQNKPEFASLVLHIKNLCKDYPSLLMAFSADVEAKVFTEKIAESIKGWGINVFMSDISIPLSAISFAITTKSMPIGLYIEEVGNNDSIKVTPISTHGGLFDEQDLKTTYINLPSKEAVIGTTDIASFYIKHLAGFADPFIEKGLSFSNFDSPFNELFEIMQRNENLKILFERDLKGPKAFLNNNGCCLTIKENNNQITTKDISLKIAKYLKEERFSSGSLFVPVNEKNKFESFGEVIEIEGNNYDLSFNAAFSDLFLGYTNDGMIAMQGSSCFGDGILASIYYLESLR